MSAVVVHAAGAVIEPATLEDALLALAKVGLPRLSMLKGGWYCSVEMHVSAVGAEFKVASEFDRRTPRDAVDQCAARVAAALRSRA